MVIAVIKVTVQFLILLLGRNVGDLDVVLLLEGILVEVYLALDAVILGYLILAE